jgi:hypothetical protein
MRVAVAALGERVSPPWWRTEFLTSAGMASMAMLFPHTGISSAVRAASEAARELHDTRVAKHGRFHLFRLPIVQERAVTALVASPEIADEIRAVVDGDDRALLKALNDLAKTIPSFKGKSGPVWVGHVHRALSFDQVAALAAYYSLAFAEGTTVFPYLDAEAAAEA